MIERKAGFVEILRRLFTVFAFGFLIAALVLGWANGRDFAWALKDEAETRLTAETGRPVSVDGRIGFVLDWTTITVFAEEVATDFSEGDTDSYAIRANHTGARLGLYDLLFKQRVDLRGVLLRDAEIVMPPRGDMISDSDEEAGERASQALEMLNRLSTVVIDNLHLIRRRTDGEPQETDIDHLILSPSDGGLVASLVGEVEGTAYDIEGHLESLADFLRDRPSPARVVAIVGQNRLQANGTVAHLWPLEAELDINTQAEDVSRIAEVVGFDLPGAGTGDLAGHVSFSGGEMNLSVTSMNINHRDPDGTIEVADPVLGPLDGTLRTRRLASGRFEVTGNLNVRHANMILLNAIEEEIDVAEGEPATALAIPYDQFDALEGRIDISLAELRHGDFVMTDLTIPLVAHDQQFILDGFVARVRGAPVSLRFTADADTEIFSFQAQGKNVDLAALASDLGQDPLIDAPATFAMHGSGSGRTLLSVAQSFTGQSNLMIGEGVMQQGGIDFLAGDLLQVLFTEGGSDTTPLACMVSRMDFENGLGRSRAFLMDTNLITITGRGRVNLAEDNVNFRLAPRPKDPTLLSLAADYNVTGPVLSPSIAPEAGDIIRGVATTLGSFALTGGAAALLPLLSGDDSTDNACIAALTGEPAPVEILDASTDATDANVAQ